MLMMSWNDLANSAHLLCAGVPNAVAPAAPPRNEGEHFLKQVATIWPQWSQQPPTWEEFLSVLEIPVHIKGRLVTRLIVTRGPRALVSWLLMVYRGMLTIDRQNLLV